MVTLAAVKVWAVAHPEFMAVVVWPIVTAIVTALFKPKTPEAYAKLPPRLAALLQLIGAIGLDAGKAVSILKKVVMGTQDAGKSLPPPEAP